MGQNEQPELTVLDTRNMTPLGTIKTVFPDPNLQRLMIAFIPPKDGVPNTVNTQLYVEELAAITRSMYWNDPGGFDAHRYPGISDFTGMEYLRGVTRIDFAYVNFIDYIRTIQPLMNSQNKYFRIHISDYVGRTKLSLFLSQLPLSEKIEINSISSTLPSLRLEASRIGVNNNIKNFSMECRGGDINFDLSGLGFDFSYNPNLEFFFISPKSNFSQNNLKEISSATKLKEFTINNFEITDTTVFPSILTNNPSLSKMVISEANGYTMISDLSFLNNAPNKTLVKSFSFSNGAVFDLSNISTNNRMNLDVLNQKTRQIVNSFSTDRLPKLPDGTVLQPTVTETENYKFENGVINFKNSGNFTIGFSTRATRLQFGSVSLNYSIDVSYENVLVNSNISFVTDGGTQIPDQTIGVGELFTRPEDPTWSGYYFVDWYTDDSYSTPFDFNSPAEPGTTIVYAKWDNTSIRIKNVFTDPVLALFMVGYLGKTSVNDIITFEELATYKERLNYRGSSSDPTLQSIDGIRYMTGVSEFEFVNTLVSDWSDLDIPGVTEIFIQGSPTNYIPDWVNVATTLETLVIRNSNLTTLSGVEKYINLLNLEVNSNPELKNIMDISQLTQLKEFVAYNCSIEDISGLSGLSLTALALANNKITELKDIKFDNLEELWIFGNPISSINFDVELPVIKKIRAANTLISNIDYFKNYTNLIELNLSNDPDKEYYNSILDFTPLSGLTFPNGLMYHNQKVDVIVKSPFTTVLPRNIDGSIVPPAVESTDDYVYEPESQAIRFKRVNSEVPIEFKIGNTVYWTITYRDIKQFVTCNFAVDMPNSDPTNPATPIDSRLFLNGDIMSSLPTPFKEGYIFVGWYFDQGYQNKVIDGSSQAPDTDFSIYARYVQRNDCYKSFDINIVNSSGERISLLCPEKSDDGKTKNTDAPFKMFMTDFQETYSADNTTYSAYQYLHTESSKNFKGVEMSFEGACMDENSWVKFRDFITNEDDKFTIEYIDSKEKKMYKSIAVLNSDILREENAKTNQYRVEFTLLRKSNWYVEKVYEAEQVPGQDVTEKYEYTYVINNDNTEKGLTYAADATLTSLFNQTSFTVNGNERAQFKLIVPSGFNNNIAEIEFSDVNGIFTTAKIFNVTDKEFILDNTPENQGVYLNGNDITHFVDGHQNCFINLPKGDLRINVKNCSVIGKSYTLIIREQYRMLGG